MIIEYIRYKIPAEKKQAFVDGYRRAAEFLRISPHCLGYELTNGNEEPDNFILRIKWNSLDGHINGFRSSTEFKSFYQAVAPFFHDIEEMKHYDFTEIYWLRSSSNS